MSVMMSPVNPKCVTGTCGPGYGLYIDADYMQVPGMSVMMSPVNPKCVTGTCGPGYGLYIDADHGHRE